MEAVTFLPIYTRNVRAFLHLCKMYIKYKESLASTQKSVKVDLIQENTGSFTTKKLLFSYEKYENAYVKRGVTVNPTIYDVSRLSGVSIATVSRAFSNPERVREDTRRKVFEAAEVLHYSPNAIARAMARQRTDKIAFLICKEGATILDEFYAGICTGIMRETNRSDFELVFHRCGLGHGLQHLQKQQVEGVSLAAMPDRIDRRAPEPGSGRGTGKQPHPGTGHSLRGVGRIRAGSARRWST